MDPEFGELSLAIAGWVVWYPLFFFGVGWVSGYQLGISWVSAGYQGFQLGISSFWRMALSLYFDEHYPELDLGAMSYWDIGRLIHIWFINRHRRLFQRYTAIIEEGIDPLPQYHLSYWQDERDSFWQCQYCSFWCELFDQRMVESHLLTRCDQGPLMITQKFHLTWEDSTRISSYLRVLTRLPSKNDEYR
jgi:hypothetical protein